MAGKETHPKSVALQLAFAGVRRQRGDVVERSTRRRRRVREGQLDQRTALILIEGGIRRLHGLCSSEDGNESSGYETRD